MITVILKSAKLFLLLFLLNLGRGFTQPAKLDPGNIRNFTGVVNFRIDIERGKWRGGEGEKGRKGEREKGRKGEIFLRKKSVSPDMID